MSGLLLTLTRVQLTTLGIKRQPFLHLTPENDIDAWRYAGLRQVADSPGCVADIVEHFADIGQFLRWRALADITPDQPVGGVLLVILAEQRFKKTLANRVPGRQIDRDRRELA